VTGRAECHRENGGRRLKLNRFTLRDRDQRLVQLSFDKLATRFSHLLIHHRVADHYRSGLLNEVISGRRDDAALDRYEALRRPTAEEVLALAGRLTTLAMVRPMSARREVRP
jgi:hypothetical protein